jgi:hypothetical protein
MNADFVRMLDNKTYGLEIEGTDTVAVVKRKFASTIDANVDDFQLAFVGWNLDDKQTAENDSIQKSCTVQLATQFKG